MYHVYISWRSRLHILAYLSEEMGGRAGTVEDQRFPPRYLKIPVFNSSQHTDVVHVCGQTHCTGVETHGQGGKRKSKENFVIRPSQWSKSLTSIGN